MFKVGNIVCFNPKRIGSNSNAVKTMRGIVVEVIPSENGDKLVLDWMDEHSKDSSLWNASWFHLV